MRRIAAAAKDIDTIIRRTYRLFVYMLGVFGCAFAISMLGISSGVDLFGWMLILTIIFFFFVFSFLILVLIAAYGIKWFRQPRNSKQAVKKRIHHKRASRFSKVDSMLSQLSDEERAYLERQLGTGELVVGDDGELMTLEEYRKKKSTPGEGGRFE